MATEKKLIKEINDEQTNERKTFENKMKAEYKLKKERWKSGPIEFSRMNLGSILNMLS